PCSVSCSALYSRAASLSSSSFVVAATGSSWISTWAHDDSLTEVMDPHAPGAAEQHLQGPIALTPRDWGRWSAAAGASRGCQPPPSESEASGSSTCRGGSS